MIVFDYVKSPSYLARVMPTGLQIMEKRILRIFPVFLLCGGGSSSVAMQSGSDQPHPLTPIESVPVGNNAPVITYRPPQRRPQPPACITKDQLSAIPAKQLTAGSTYPVCTPQQEEEYRAYLNTGSNGEAVQSPTSGANGIVNANSCFSWQHEQVDVGFGEWRTALRWDNRCSFEVNYGYFLNVNSGDRHYFWPRVLSADPGERGLTDTGNRVTFVGSCKANHACFRALEDAIELHR